MPKKTISHVNMQKLATSVILLAMSPVLLVLVVVSATYFLSVLLSVSGILEQTVTCPHERVHLLS